jgi:hypothetical protein
MSEIRAAPLIFVSYSHKDEPLELSAYQVQWHSYVMRFLKSAFPAAELSPWSDQNILGSQDWDHRINDALDRCDGFVLLVSSNSLTSRYILDVEVGRILERQGAGGSSEYPFIYPIVISPSAGIDKFPWLALPMRRPKYGMALSDFEQSVAVGKRDAVMKEIAEEVVKVADIAIHWRNTHGREAPERPHPGPFVDITRLPETPYRRLVGRDKELSRLDTAFALHSGVSVLSIISWGGAGKTTLINEWLTRLQRDTYRDAEAVLAWSFYDQGTKERGRPRQGVNCIRHRANARNRNAVGRGGRGTFERQRCIGLRRAAT